MATVEPTKTLSSVVSIIKKFQGIREAVVLSRGGDILYSKKQRPFLVNSVPFIVSRMEQAGKLFSMAHTRYVAMQRGRGRKLLIIASPTLLLGLEADETCLQKMLLDKFLPVLQAKI